MGPEGSVIVQRTVAAVWRNIWPSRAWAFVRTYVAAVNNDRLLGLAAETAFFAVLSIFPGLLVAASLLNVLDVFVGANVAAGAKHTVVTALDTVLTEQASGVRASVADLFETSRDRLLTLATAGALVTLSGAFAVVINALNLTYSTIENRSWLRRRFLGLLMGIATLLAIVLALAVIVVGPFLGLGGDLADLVGLDSADTVGTIAVIWTVLRLPVLLIGLILWATAIFHYAPNRRNRWRESWRESLPGALMTAVLWIVATLGFHLYVNVVAGVNPVLGAFGGGAIVMIWIYLLSLALLLGGEFNATLRPSIRSIPK